MREADKKPGRQPGFRKENPLSFRKAVRFTKAEHEGITMALAVTNEKESEFMRDAIDAKVKRTLKKAGIDINTL